MESRVRSQSVHVKALTTNGNGVALHDTNGVVFHCSRLPYLPFCGFDSTIPKRERCQHFGCQIHAQIVCPEALVRTGFMIYFLESFGG
jgi:hypothetical protein